MSEPADDHVMSDAQTIKELKETELKLRGQLRHIRTWLTKVQQKVYHLDPSAVKNSKRLYVGGLPPNSVEEAELKAFLEEKMSSIGLPVSPGSPITGVRMTKEKGFAFVEFRCVEEASNAIALNGIKFGESRLKIKRPSNYDEGMGMLLGPTTPDPTLDLSGLDLEIPKNEQSMDKIFVGGLPSDWGENEVKELLMSFGELRNFTLVKDKQTGNSKGYAFCEYSDENVTDLVIKQLNQSSAGSRILTVKRALEGESVGGGGKRGARGSAAPGGSAGFNSGSANLLNLMTGGAVAGPGSGSMGGNIQPAIAPLLPNTVQGHGWQQQPPGHHLPATNAAFGFQPTLGGGSAGPGGGGMQGQGGDGGWH